MDYFLKLQLFAWFEMYYQPEKLERLEKVDPGFKQRYFNSLSKDLKEKGWCAISKFDSTIGRQVEFKEDPNNLIK